jgi:hypothetical protein
MVDKGTLTSYDKTIKCKLMENGDADMKRIRGIIGIVLILAAIAGLIYWETAGREAVLTEPVLAAKKTILPGTVVNASLFETIGVMKESRIKGALRPERLGEICGKTSLQLIPGNAQITADFFRNDDFCLKEGESIFALKPEWIAMRSSSLRRGDWVTLYSSITKVPIGSYQIAFVKDEKEAEIRSIAGISSAVLDRTDATAVISHVEIITNMDDYSKILDVVEGGIPETLILVQKEVKTD